MIQALRVDASAWGMISLRRKGRAQQESCLEWSSKQTMPGLCSVSLGACLSSGPGSPGGKLNL